MQLLKFETNIEYKVYENDNYVVGVKQSNLQYSAKYIKWEIILEKYIDLGDSYIYKIKQYLLGTIDQINKPNIEDVKNKFGNELKHVIN